MYLPVDEESFARFVAEAARRAPAVRRVLQRAGVDADRLPPAAELLAGLPVTSKVELSRQQQEDPPFGGWVACGFEGLARVLVSPGPIYNVEAAVPDDWGATDALRAAGFGPGDLVINTFSYHLSPASFIAEAGLRALGAAVVPAGTGARSEQVRLLAHLPVTGYTGVPTYLKALLDEWAAAAGAAGWALAGPPGRLRRAWFTGEPLPEALRRQFREAWGIESFQGYGTAEVGIVAYECPVHRGLHLGRHAVVELLDPATRQPVPEGEVGEVVISSLRPAYPLLRLATGDLSRMVREPCPCGRPSPRLEGVLGRVGSGVKVRGMFVYPHQIEELARSIPGVARVAARVERVDFRDRLTLEVEPGGERGPERGGGTSAPADETLAQTAAAVARDRLRVRPDEVRVVPPGTLEGRPPLTDARPPDGG